MILSAHWLGDSSHSKVEFYTLPSQLIDLYCLFFLLVRLNDNFEILLNLLKIISFHWILYCHTYNS